MARNLEGPIAGFLIGAGVGVIICVLALATALPQVSLQAPPLFQHGKVPTMTPTPTRHPVHRDPFTATSAPQPPRTPVFRPGVAVRTPVPVQTATRAPTARPEPSRTVRPAPSVTVTPVLPSAPPAAARPCRVGILGVCIL